MVILILGNNDVEKFNSHLESKSVLSTILLN